MYMQDMMNKKNRFLHVSPHLGGGVGQVLINYFKHANYKIDSIHQIASLDSINENAKLKLNENNIQFSELIFSDIDKLFELISESDIVVIHWWNHPLLFTLMVKYKLPPCRLIIWSHISGNEAPQIFTNNLLNYPDFFVFTTPISFYQTTIQCFSDQAKLKTIWSTGGFSHINPVRSENSSKFNIGYLGTVDFAKMHPEFVDMCAKINIPNVHFIVCGGGCDLDTLKQEVKKRGIESRFTFTGFVQNISSYFAKFDVFGYPLNRHHYGSCDQALAEAMASGVVPVVFNNEMENYMVHHSYSGLVAQNTEDYIAAIESLYMDSTLRNRLSQEAKSEAYRRFDIYKTLEDWENLYKEVLSFTKTVKHWKGKYAGFTTLPHQVFLESVGDYSSAFESGELDRIMNLYNTSFSWKSKTKGTAEHYLSFFYEDEKLIQWSQLNNFSK